MAVSKNYPNAAASQTTPLFKDIVQRILRGVNTTLKYVFHPRKLEAQPFFVFNFKGTPSQEEHKTIFSGLKINKMTLSG